MRVTPPPRPRVKLVRVTQALPPRHRGTVRVTPPPRPRARHFAALPLAPWHRACPALRISHGKLHMPEPVTVTVSHRVSCPRAPGAWPAAAPAPCMPFSHRGPWPGPRLGSGITVGPASPAPWETTERCLFKKMLYVFFFFLDLKGLERVNRGCKITFFL